MNEIEYGLFLIGMAVLTSPIWGLVILTLVCELVGHKGGHCTAESPRRPRK